MKTQLIVLLFVSLLALTDCKDKEEKVKPSEKPLTTFLTEENGFEMKERGSGPWELGVVFSASVPGKITQLGSKMPEPGSYRVLIWEYDTKNLLRQKTVEQTSPNKLTLENVDELILEPNKKYVISINSQIGGVNKKYFYAATASSSNFMPFTVGSILVHEACYTSVATVEFPGNVTAVKYELYGFPEFTFIPD